MKLNKRIINPFSVAALTGICSVANAAFDDAGTDYTNALQQRHVWNEALEPVELVNSILCFSSQMLPTEFVNAGPYLVLADEAQCFDQEDNGQAGNNASNTPSYMEVIVNVTRDSDTTPLIINAWIPGMEAGEDEEAIKFKAVVSEGANGNNPFGQFTFNFEFFDSIDSTVPHGGGEVKTVDTNDDQIGFTFYESSERDGFQSEQSASVVMNSDRSSGTALTSSSWDNFGQAYGLTFNNENVLVQNGPSYDDLPFQDGDNSGSCLSRTDFDDAVWRYDLFDSQTGDQIEIDSGFSFRYDSDNDEQVDSYGHIGYWGVWTEEEGALNNGDIIESEDPVSGTVSQYTIVKAPGRLIKHSVETLPLTDVRGIELNYWDDNAIQSGFDSWIVNYLTVTEDGVNADGFYLVAGINWGDESGPERTDVTDSLINLSTNETVYLYSEQLGGDINYKAGDTDLTFFRQTIVNGSETGNDELLNTGSVTLHCFERCPIGTLSSNDLQNFDGVNSPYDASVNSVGSAIQYTFSDTGANMLTLVRNSNDEAVKFADGLTEESLANSPHQWGLRSGPMVTPDVAAAMSNPWDIFDPNIVTEYYVWEAGIHHWNQLATVKDVNDEIRSFDRPIQLSYRHSDASDRTGNAGDYDNALVMLNYGGNGDLWGIPHESDSSTEHGFPAFNIADGVVMGPNDEFVIKAREIEQTMADATGQCTDLVIDEPAVPVPTAVTGDADIGTMPIVTSAPKVIAGVLQVQE